MMKFIQRAIDRAVEAQLAPLRKQITALQKTNRHIREIAEGALQGRSAFIRGLADLSAQIAALPRHQCTDLKKQLSPDSQEMMALKHLSENWRVLNNFIESAKATGNASAGLKIVSPPRTGSWSGQ